MNHNVDLHSASFILTFPFAVAILLYIIGYAMSIHKGKKWPFIRVLLWTGGGFCAIFSVYGPIAEQMHDSFIHHMVGHLLLGMLAPLLMTLSAPMTLLLRSLPVSVSRGILKLLKSKFVRFYTDPLVTAILNIGGLWLLYATELFDQMHQHIWLYVVIHFHIFLAGYLFTLSFIAQEPFLRLRTFRYRAVVLVLALGGHCMLAKYIYAYPPVGVATADAQYGGMLMFYGGDLIDAVIIFMLCVEWFNANKPREFKKMTENVG